MGQIIFESCENDFEADAKPIRSLTVSRCQNVTRQKRYVVGELKKIGDGLNAKYYFANVLHNVIHDLGINSVAGVLLTGLHSVLMLKNLLS